MKTREAEIKEAIEKSIEILDGVQGGWCAVTETYAPEWAHPFKEASVLLEGALDLINLERKGTNKVAIPFKAVPCFYSMYNSREMPFTLRQFDPEDWRFQILEEDWRQCAIEIQNTETGERIKRNVKGYEHLPPCYGDFVLIRF